MTNKGRAPRGIPELCRELGISIETAAKYTPASVSSMRRWASGAVVMPFAYAPKVAEGFRKRGADVSAAELFMASVKRCIESGSETAMRSALKETGSVAVKTQDSAAREMLASLIEQMLAVLRGPDYQHAEFSGDGNGLAVDVVIDDNREPQIGLGGRPETTTTEFGMTAALSRDGLGRSRSATKSAPARDGLGRARPAAEPVQRDGMGRRRKGQ